MLKSENINLGPQTLRVSRMKVEVSSQNAEYLNTKTDFNHQYGSMGSAKPINFQRSTFLKLSNFGFDIRLR